MDPTQLLRKQHRRVEQLFKQIEKADDPGQCRQLLNELTRDLELHTHIEETIFYPALREFGPRKAEEMVLEAYEEHGVVKLVLAQLPEVDPEDERFHAKMTVLKELIEHHVEEEEGEIFKLVAKIPPDQRDALAEQMQAEAGAPAGKRPPRGSRRAA